MPDPQSTQTSPARARAEVPDDAIDLLLRQHRQVRRLFEVYNREKGEGKKETSQRISDVLLLHVNLEEEFLYPALRRFGNPDLKRQIEESLREHHEAEGVLFQISNLRFDRVEFEELMQKLEDDVLHHIEMEETDVLPQARDLLPDLDVMGREMAARLDTLHPAEIRNQWARKGTREEG